MLNVRRLTVVLVILAALAAAAVASTAFAATHARATAAKFPPCTKAALAAGIRRGPAAVTNGTFLKPFGCVRNWAYSGVLIGTGRAAFEATVLYHNRQGRWQTSQRPGPCRTHAVPKKIFQPACETN